MRNPGIIVAHATLTATMVVSSLLFAFWLPVLAMAALFMIATVNSARPLPLPLQPLSVLKEIS